MCFRATLSVAISALGERNFRQRDAPEGVRLTQVAEVLDVVAGFQLERPLGRGGMGVVYRARDERLGRWVALKLIAPALANEDRFRTRFERECRLAATVDHPNLIPIYEAGEADGRLFLAMRLVEGTNLRTLIRSELRLAPARAARLVAQIAAGLDAAHDRGLVHRDVKPENILIVDPGAAEHVYLTDFGVARLAEESTDAAETEYWVGTPDYVAPEQLRAEPVDRRADVYGLGCVLFHALTGHVPFEATNVGEKLAAQLSAPPPRLSADLPVARTLDDVVARALAKDPDDRFSSAGDFAAAVLAAVEETPSLPRHRVGRGAQSPPPPVPATRTFGREDDVIAVCELLARPDTPSVTLTGMGGVGKTRLALEVGRAAAESFPDSVRFASLGAVDKAERVAESVAQQLGARIDGADPVTALGRALGGKQALVVLDNFEHLLAAGALIEQIRSRCPGVKVLATSREPLRLASEHVYQVAPLADRAAVELFVDRARAHDPAFSLSTGDAGTVAAICRRLDRLPLALELAAGRTVLFSPAELLARLDDTLTILGDGPRDAPLRQRTLRATIDWSYDLLDEDERTAFTALAVFADGADLDAVEAITRAGPGSLAALVAKNLVVRREMSDHRTRLRLLETVREYAAERLAEDPAARDLRTAHCRYYCEFAEQAELGLRGRDQPAWARRLDEDLENLRDAMSWALREEPAEVALRLAGAVGLFLGFQRGQLGEVRGWLEAALRTASEAPLRLRAKACLALAVALQNLGESEHALGYCGQAVGLYRRSEDRAGLAQSLSELSFMEFESPAGGADRAAAAGQEALDVARTLDDDWVTLFALCANLWLASDLAVAKRLASDALAIARRLGVPDQQTMLLSNIGFRALEDGDYEYAHEATAEAVALHRRTVDDVAGFAVSLGNLGLVATMRGDDAEADGALRETLLTCLEHGLARPVSEALVAMAALSARTADHERAARLCGAAAAMACDAPTTTDRKLEAEARELATAVLRTDRWREEWDAGRRLRFEEAIEYAVGRPEPAVT